MGRIRGKYRFAALAVAATCAIASIAYTECGDVDGSGSVTVTDGVQVLRGVAGLSSLCTLALCDVDGNGSITVTDAVNVLRTVAGLPSNATCSSVNQQVAAVIGDVQPLLEVGLGFIPGSASSAAKVRQAKVSEAATGGQSIPCDVGSIVITQTLATFQQCTLGGITLNGTIGGSASTVDFALSITDIASADTVTIDGGVGFVLAGTVKTLNGDIAFSSTFEGRFGLAFQQLQVQVDPGNGSKTFLGGALVADLSGSGLAGLQTLTIQPNGTNIAAVNVGLTAGGTAAFSLDLQTGALTPA